MNNKKAVVLLSLAAIFGILALADRWLAAIYGRHDELVKLAECYPFPCAADFNGNGTLDRLEVVQKNPTDSADWRLKVADGERELFNIPYDGTDGTFRTHAAIYKPAQVELPHLLIYDGASRQHIRAAYVWDGGKMSEIKPSDLEHEIISAMAARDDTGGWNTWVLWRLTSTILLPIYLVAGGVLILFSTFWLGRGRTLSP